MDKLICHSSQQVKNSIQNAECWMTIAHMCIGQTEPSSIVTKANQDQEWMMHSHTLVAWVLGVHNDIHKLNSHCKQSVDEVRSKRRNSHCKEIKGSIQQIMPMHWWTSHHDQSSVIIMLLHCDSSRQQSWFIDYLWIFKSLWLWPLNSRMMLGFYL